MRSAQLSSHENELTWLALKKYNSRTDPFGKNIDIFVCEMNVYGAILARTFKTPNSATSEQCRVSYPQFPRSICMERLGPCPPFCDKTVAFSDSGFPTEAPVTSNLRDSYYLIEDNF